MKRNFYLLMMAVIVAIAGVPPVQAQDFAFTGRDITTALDQASKNVLGFSFFGRGVTGDVGGTVLNTVANDVAALQANGLATWSVLDVGVGDFNGDGRLDIASVSGAASLGFDASRLTVMYGLGDGTFGPPQVVDITTGLPVNLDRPVSMAVGDADLDGDADIAIAMTNGSGSNVIRIYRGAIGGVSLFATITATAGVNINIMSVTFGRFNADPFLDVAAVFANHNAVHTAQTTSGIVLAYPISTTPTAAVLPTATSSGNPLLSGFYGTGIAPRAVTARESNMAEPDPGLGTSAPDSDVDIFVACGASAEIVFNNSTGTPPPIGTAAGFSNTMTGIYGAALGAGTNAVGVVTADINNDNKFDVVVLSQGGGNVTTYLGLTNPSAVHPFFYAQPVTSAVGTNPISLTTMEFNGDGRLDLLVSRATTVGSGAVTVLTGNGAGVFTPAASVGLPLPLGIAAGRISGGPTDDIVIGDNLAGTILLASSEGYNTVQVPVFTNTSLTAAFDGTALNDVVLIEQNFNAVIVVLNPGTGSLNVGTILVADVFTAFQVTPTSATSFRGANGQNNLAFTDVATPTATTGFGQIVVALNNGSGVFRDVFQFRQFVATPGATNITGGDFNNDGIEDLAYIDYNSNFAAVALNDTTDFFLSPRFRETGGFQPVSAAVGDFNDDDHLDMAVLNIGAVNQANQSLVSIMLGAGDGSLRPTGALLQVPNIGISIIGGLQDTDAQGLGRAASLALGRQVDFNNDGFPDLAVVSTAGGRGSVADSPTPTVTLLLNREDAPGNFTVESPIELVDDQIGGGVQLNVDRPQGLSGRPPTFQGGVNNLMSVGDYNADGSPDLVIGGYTTANVFRSTLYMFGNQTARTVRVSRPIRGGGSYGGTNVLLQAGDFFVGAATGEFRALLNIVPDVLLISATGNVWIDENQTSILNHAPILTIQRSDLNAPRPGGGRKVIITAGEAARIPVTATDVDRSASTGAGDLVKFSLAPTPSGIQPPSFLRLTDNANNTATVEVPAGADINRGPGNAVFRIAVEGTDLANVSAGGRLPLRGRTYFTLIVRPNRPPVVGAIPNQTVEAGRTATVSLSISDADGHRVSAAVRCDRGNFASISGTTLSLAPGAGDVGTTTCTVTATDEFGLAGSANFAVTVIAANQPPTIAPISDVTLRAGEVRTVAVNASDPNGNAGLRLSIVSAPAFVSLSDNGNGTGSIRIAPALTDTTGGRVTVQVTDPGGLSAQTSFNVTVQRAVVITAASFAKQSDGSALFISGIGFGSSGARVSINGTDVSSRIVGQSDTSITLKGSKKKLNLRKGANQIVVTAGGVTSNTFVLNLLTEDDVE
ncbi:MAG: FG-GAP-like repeat-containing protein [Acidobacteriota bacterium]|nr:FG-GAP-like repeat-containing protein [Acidobacteriota bacterium]